MTETKGAGNINEFDKELPKVARFERSDPPFLYVEFNVPGFGPRYTYSGVGISPNTYGYNCCALNECPQCQSYGPFVSAACVSEGVCMACGEVLLKEKSGRRDDDWAASRVVQLFYACAEAGLIDEEKFKAMTSKKYFIV